MSCTSLRHLNLSGNALVRLPDLLGTLPQLTNLNVAANRLTQLPLSLGYAKVLTELVVEDNPLVDPPIEETVKGLDHFKWYMRSKLQVCHYVATVSYHWQVVNLSICIPVFVVVGRNFFSRIFF